VQGNHDQRNQQANLPLFNIKMMTTQMTCKSLKRGSEKLFPLFSFFKSLLFFFVFFYFIKCKGGQKQICSGKGEKKMVDLGVREKIQMQLVERRMG
jgi:ABC-type uncharacterized transport system permease subunit